MSTAVATIYQRMRTSSLSIGKLTFGGFSLVFVIIMMTSAVSIFTLRDLGNTFMELQRMQDVGDVAEQIDRRVNELRLAARDYVTDPGAQSNRVWEAMSVLSILLTKSRDELGSDQRQMLEGASIRLAVYREGITRVSALIDRRTELLANLGVLRGKLEATVKQGSDNLPALTLLGVQNRISSALLARDPAAASTAAYAPSPSPGSNTAPGSAAAVAASSPGPGQATMICFSLHSVVHSSVKPGQTLERPPTVPTARGHSTRYAPVTPAPVNSAVAAKRWRSCNCRSRRGGGTASTLVNLPSHAARASRQNASTSCPFCRGTARASNSERPSAAYPVA